MVAKLVRSNFDTITGRDAGLGNLHGFPECLSLCGVLVVVTLETDEQLPGKFCLVAPAQ